MLKETLQEIVVVLLVVVLAMLLLLQLQIVQKVVHGNSATASKLQTARKITLDGAVKGEIKFDGNSDVVVNTIQNNIAVISGQMILEANSQSNLNSNIEQQTILNIDFPRGFNKDNCFCLTFGIKTNEDKNYSYGVGDSISNRSFTGSLIRNVILGASNDNSKIALHVWQPSTSQKTAYYRLVLMKIPTYVEGVDYKLGDVDQNGKVEEKDGDMVLQYTVGKSGLTEQQRKAADVNKDGSFGRCYNKKICSRTNKQF